MKRAGIAMMIFLGCSPAAKKEARLLEEAAAIHNEAIRTAAAVENDLKKLSEDPSVPADSLQILQTAVKAWEEDLVEVPGNEHHDHAEGDHHHHHHGEKQPDLTAEQMLGVQKDLKSRMDQIKKRVDALK